VQPVAVSRRPPPLFLERPRLRRDPDGPGRHGRRLRCGPEERTERMEQRLRRRRRRSPGETVKATRAFAAAVLTAAAALTGAPTAPTPGPANPKPVLFGEGIFSTAADEFGAALSPAGEFAFFNRSVPRSQLYTIFRTNRSGSAWRSPEVASFSGRWRDFDPVFGPSGRPHFTSARPIPGHPADGEYNMRCLDPPPTAPLHPHALA